MSNTDVEFIFTSNEFGHVGSETHKICCIWSPLVIPEFKKKMMMLLAVVLVI